MASASSISKSLEFVRCGSLPPGWSFLHAEQIHCQCPHHGCVDTVFAGRASASLHVAQDRGSGLDAGRCLDTARHTGGMSDALRIDDDMMLLAALPVVDNVVDQLLLVVIVILRKQNVLGAVGDAAPQGNVACVTCP